MQTDKWPGRRGLCVIGGGSADRGGGGGGGGGGGATGRSIISSARPIVTADVRPNILRLIRAATAADGLSALRRLPIRPNKGRSAAAAGAETDSDEAEAAPATVPAAVSLNKRPCLGHVTRRF